MQFKSQYFDTISEALGVAAKLVEDDFDASKDRQIIGNFYNGRALMTEDEAEAENIGNIVNHLFGYAAIDRLRSQISSILSNTDSPWKVKVQHPDMNVAQQDQLSQVLSAAFCRRLNRSRRLKPQWRASAGNQILHGRDIMAFRDSTDWCPRSSFLYVPQDAEPSRESLPYAFSPENLSFDQLISYRKAARKDPSRWNERALNEAIESVKPGFVANPIIENNLDDAKTAEHENVAPNDPEDGQLSTRSTLPVWYLYEVDHEKPGKPVSLSIISRYSVLARDGSGDKIDREVTLFHQEAFYKSVRHWIIPFFIDSEIGGNPKWNSAVGVGKLNYDRDSDIEEFFNLAMEGAKDAMRTKWKVMEGASREKIMRFFAENQDLVPEGLEVVKIDTAGNYQNAFQVIQILRQLSAEDAASTSSNMGTPSDELEIQAQQRMSAAAATLANRMADVYDSLDDMGAEMLRRFLSSPAISGRIGSEDIMLFRKEIKEAGIDDDVRRMLAEEEHGELKWITVRAVRAIGDGSRANEIGAATELMKAMGSYAPQAQEKIKHRFALVHTRDPEFANELVPANHEPNPDQVARARNENQAAMSRGIIGFVPQINADDVPMIHAMEHGGELEAIVARGQAAGGLDQGEFAGFQSLAQHQHMTAEQMKSSGAPSEQANAILQSLEKLSNAAEGLFKAHQEKMQSEEISAAERIKLQQKDRDQDLRERAQASVEQDRQVRNDLESRKISLDETVKMNKVAADVTQAVTPAPDNGQQ